MRRKIIRQGNKSFTFTLPVKWVRQHRLEGGEEIDIKEEDGNLILSSELSKSQKSTAMSVKGMTEKNIRFVMNQLYRRGFTKIKFTSVTTANARVIEDLVDQHFSGVEVIRKKGDEVIVEVITEPKADSFEKIFRKMFYLISDSLKIIVDKEDTKRITTLTDKTRVYSQFCKRYISNNVKSLEGFELYSSISYIIIIQTNINRAVKMKMTRDFKILKDLFDRVSENFYKRDLNGLYKTQKESVELYEKLLKNKNPILTNTIRIIYGFHSPLIGLCLSGERHIV